MTLEGEVKFEEKLTCGLENNEEFGKFLPKHSKVSKLALWRDPFIQSRESMSLKFTEEVFFMTKKNDAKFEEELASRFKIDMRNLTNFDLKALESLKRLHFNGVLLNKLYK